MRKLFALAMVAVLSLTIAVAVMGCGKKAEETSTPAEQSAAPAESSGAGAMQDTSAGHMAQDTTAHK